MHMPSPDIVESVTTGPRLSVVAVSRNDDHGGSMTRRMQFFVDGFVEQCKRHQLDAELILVEWNPPVDRPPLVDALRWPAESGPARIRIVTVPPETHNEFAHSLELPLFQMIGKNVGIRRARGQYVLATNVDILFDDELVLYLRDMLAPNTILRIDRYDVPSDLPADVPFETVLVDCRRRFFQVNTRFGIFDVAHKSLRGMTTAIESSVVSFVYGMPILGMNFRRPWRGWPRAIFGHIKIAAQITIAVAINFVLSIAQTAVSFVQFLMKDRRQGRPWSETAYRILRSIIRRCIYFVQRIWRIGRGIVTSSGRSIGLFPPESAAAKRLRTSRWLHTWACGDFTLMARDDWSKLRGYPEWAMYSWHIDSVIMFAAHAHGLQQIRLGPEYRIFHIDHSLGSGWSPKGENALFSRLDAKGIPYLSNEALQRLQIDFANDPGKAVVNDDSWGLANRALPERSVLSGTAAETETRA